MSGATNYREEGRGFVAGPNSTTPTGHISQIREGPMKGPTSRWDAFKDTLSKYALLVYAIVLGIGEILRAVFQGSEPWGRVAIIAVAGFALLLLVLLLQRVDNINEKLTLKITYYSAHDKHERAKLFNESKKIIEKAEEEILALNSFIEERPRPDEDLEPRKRYFEALKKQRQRVRYCRVLQIPEKKEVRGFFDEESYMEHFRWMVQERDQQREKPEETSDRKKRIELWRVPPKYPSTFLIIDASYILWPLYEEQGGGLCQMRGEFIIHDPGGRIIADFMKWFENA
jgi:hypothetical protein